VRSLKKLINDFTSKKLNEFKSASEITYDLSFDLQEFFLENYFNKVLCVHLNKLLKIESPKSADASLNIIPEILLYLNLSRFYIAQEARDLLE